MNPGRPTVLIVDDDPSIRTMLQRSLAAGYDLLTATDGAQAIDMFRLGEGDIDVILLDLGMPGLSGYEALAQLQLIDADVKVVVITGLEPDEERLPGVAGILHKPFRPDDVQRMIARVLA